MEEVGVTNMSLCDTEMTAFNHPRWFPEMVRNGDARSSPSTGLDCEIQNGVSDP